MADLFDVVVARKLSGGGGGGGSSDFSTATVTVVNNSTDFEWVYAAIYTPENILLTDYGNLTSGTYTYTMPLYKGLLILSTLNVFGNVSVSGACEYADEQFIITGDCTITIS